MNAVEVYGRSIEARLGADAWLRYWASFHESGHATVARHFGHEVENATLDMVTITHRAYTAPGDRNSKERLIISASGDAVTSRYFGYTCTGEIDNQRQRDRLRGLGASDDYITVLMTEARKEAEALVMQLRDQIEEVAAELRTYGRLNQDAIDTAIRAARR